MGAENMVHRVFVSLIRIGVWENGLPGPLRTYLLRVPYHYYYFPV